MQFKNILYFFILIGMLATSCAQQGTLSGGKKDETPPQMDLANSTPNLQTNFEKQDLKFVFDEWLQLNDVFNQVVISPPLQKKHEITLKGKTVLFKFNEDEALREDATYTINFGDAVQDLTERNPVKDFRFVFSTGDVIDSLEVGGQVIDAYTKEPVEDAIVMLYDNLADSVVRTEKPFYFGRTDKGGLFQIKNVRADTFKAFVLIDNGISTLQFDDGEKIAFIDSSIVVTDSTRTVLSFSLFQEELDIELQDEYIKKYGHVNFEFNRKPLEGEIEITAEDFVQKTYVQMDKDSMKLWYDLSEDRNWEIFVRSDTTFYDTITVKKLSRAEFLEENKLHPTKKIKPTTVNSIPPNQPFSLAFVHPLESIDTSFIELLADTLLQRVAPIVTIDSLDKRNLLVNFSYKEKVPYQLTLFPNALTDFFGLKNDTLVFKLEAAAKDDFSDLTLTVVDMNPDKGYVIELLDKGEEIIETLVMSGDTSFTKKLTTMPTGKYSVRIIHDTNKNGRWDTGDYDDKRQPEIIFSSPIEELRAGWEVDATISVKEVKASLPVAPPTPTDTGIPKSAIPKAPKGKN